MLLTDLPNWPPIVGGPSTIEYKFPTAGEGVLNGVYPANDNHVTFSCTFEGHEFRCHLNADSAEDAEKITELLTLNIGKTLKAVGELKVGIARTASR
jgi:hypothetical protein